MNSRDILDAVEHATAPLRNRLLNAIARAVVKAVDDSAKMQRLQLEVIKGEVVDGCEHFQGYGFASVSLPGAEAVVIFPGGDRSHPLVIGVDDRRHRPTDMAAGEVKIYNNAGAHAHLKADGSIEIQPAAGKKVFIKRAGGSTDALVAKTEHNEHTHPSGMGPTSTPTVPAVGTAALESE